MSSIYTYFEDGIKDENNTYTYVCKLCKEKGIHRVIKGVTTSNLIAHIKTEIHQREYLKFEAKQTECRTPKSKKIKLEFGSPLSSCISQSPKYPLNSSKYKERYHFNSLEYLIYESTVYLK